MYKRLRYQKNFNIYNIYIYAYVYMNIYVQQYTSDQKAHGKLLDIITYWISGKSHRDASAPHYDG